MTMQIYYIFVVTCKCFYNFFVVKNKIFCN
nr:MAG TPA: hypothetical protein [Caudoviricetes sp.]